MGRRAEEPQTEAGRQIWKALEKMEARGHSRDRVFRDWLDLMLSALLSQTQHTESGRKTEQPQNEHEDAYMAIVGRYADDKPQGNRAIDHMTEAYGALLLGIQNNEPDPLGDLYMAAISYGEHGQYFTPMVVADLIAAVNMQGIEDGQTVADPSGCGSGVMLMAAAKINPRAHFLGIDLDERCAKMATLNLTLRGLTGRVYWGDGLTGEMHTSWTFNGGHIWRDDKPTGPMQSSDEPKADKRGQLRLL